MAFLFSWSAGERRKMSAWPGGYGFVVSVVVELELSVLAFTTLPCFFLAFVVLFEVLVVDVEPEGSDAELVVVDDLSVFTFRPSSELVVAVVVEFDSLDWVVWAIIAAAVINTAIIIFMPGEMHAAVHPPEACNREFSAPSGPAVDRMRPYDRARSFPQGLVRMPGGIIATDRRVWIDCQASRQSGRQMVNGSQPPARRKD
jgi:hypothetical protein